MASDSKRLQQVYQHIQDIKAGAYPAIVGRDDNYQIVERPWKELAEPSKLAILQDAVNWSGVTNKDQAHILLSEIDPGRITDAQRNRLIDMADVKPSWDELLAEAAASEQEKDRGMER